jgi:hypothetical protein
VHELAGNWTVQSVALPEKKVTAPLPILFAGRRISESVDVLPNGTLAGVASTLNCVGKATSGVIVVVAEEAWPPGCVVPVACAMPGMRAAVPSDATPDTTAIVIARRQAR